MTTTAIEAAVAAYADLGWSVFPIPEGEKKTTELGWPDAPDDPDRVLREQPANVAVRLGERSSYLADVDLDDDAARAVAPLLLPATGCQLGRDNVTGITHRLYVCPDGPPRGQPGTTKKGAVELRWTGAYTVVPPSRHPEGGRYRWQPGDYQPLLAPPPVAWSTLHRSVTEVAAAALLLRCYSEWAREGNRHLATMALSGALLSEGWDLPRVERFVFALATAGADEEAADRVDNARSQWDALQRGQPMTGWPSLAGYAGRDAVDLVKRYLGIRSGSVWAATMGSRQNGAGGAPGQPPQSTQTPNVAPKQPAQPPAPVIATAQQAAQQASAQARTQAVKDAEVAFQTHLAIMGQFWLARDEGLGLYVYENGVYRYDPGEMRLRLAIQTEVLRIFGVSYLKPELVNNVIYHLQVNAPDLDPIPERGWLHVINGRVNVVTGDLEPHDPRHRTTTLLPVVYDPTAQCPRIEAFCAQVFPADALAAGVPWEVAALAIHPFKGIDKAILLLGEGENGKGIFLDLMRAFVGSDNCSYVSLQKMGGNTFATSDLKGKLLNVCMDLPSLRLEDSGDFKAIVSGETIRAERKGMPAFHFVPYCRLLYSANNSPESADTSQGYVRRWHIIPFDRTFDRDNPARRARVDLERETQLPGELSGLLNLALPHVRRFLEGGQPTSTPTMDAAVEEFRSILDPFPVWLRGSLLHDPQGFVATEHLVTRYKFGRRGPAPQISYKQVAKAMQAEFPAATADQRRVGGSGRGTGQSQGQTTAQGKLLRGWRGVSWRNPWP